MRAASLERRLAALATLSPARLRSNAEQELSGVPAGYSPDLLRLAIAYALQEKRGERLPPGIAREIRRATAVVAAGGDTSLPPQLRPGARLAREWHGHSHHVLVSEDGFEYRGQRYRSLSAIARAITGTAWSGPRFFGLTRLANA